MADQFESLAPRDILITLRSLERRIGGVIGQVRSDPEVFSRIDEESASGKSFADIASDGSVSTSTLARALATAATATRKMSADQAISAPGNQRLALEDAQERIGKAANSVADALDSIDNDDWAATIEVDGGQNQSIIDLAREVARRGINTLRDLEVRKDQIS